MSDSKTVEGATHMSDSKTGLVMLLRHTFWDLTFKPAENLWAAFVWVPVNTAMRIAATSALVWCLAKAWAAGSG